MDGLNIHSGGYTEKHNKCHKKYHMVGKFEQILVYMTAYILKHGRDLKLIFYS